MVKVQNAPFMAGSHTPQFYTLTWKSNEGQTILWNYSIAMWFLHSLCIVLYITVIICICTVPMARSHILVHLIWWKDPRNVLIGGLLNIEEHNLLLFANAPVNGLATHWYLVL